MNKQELDTILQKIARKHHTTVDEVRSEMMLAIEEGQQSTEPSVQARWNAIPRKGAKITLEEFLTYLVGKS